MRRTPDRLIVHIGLGAFHRSHQAWFTARAHDGDRWAITAYSGRRPDAADALQAQDGLYTLIERGEGGDRATVMDIITEAVDGGDVDHLMRSVADPHTSVVTLTITEAGYEWSDELEADRLLLAGVDRSADDHPATALGRLALALDSRRLAGAGPVALVSCDNLPDNGAVLRAALRPLLDAIGPDTAAWVEESVGFVSSSVDRITPRSTTADEETAEALTGFRDPCVVVTEPFADWTMSDDFPAGRPAWETAGARIVDDVEPFERRKLWLLNGAHTLLAAAGPGRGHAFVDEAFADPVLRSSVEGFWDECVRHLPDDLDLDRYRADLASRFGNSAIRHSLEQIATGAEAKLRVRILPVIAAERAAGRSGTAAAVALAAHLARLSDGRTPEHAAVRSALERIADASVDDAVVDLVTDLITTSRATSAPTH
ncbi:mannitol dehydrogenase family protein [Labedella endophytica]|uniref:mannitol dehydrogenase family protein n=1 Tax=Labedella endophytica TaxID=1523160 RepID=UPI001FB5781E|nr:mannitol dehydrogenase family protein [Labedella endophytica]